MKYPYDENEYESKTAIPGVKKPVGETVRVGVIERFFNNHVKVIAMICTLLVIGACFWGIERLKDIGFFDENQDYEGVQMEMPYVIGLEEKPEAICWPDLKGMTYEEMSRSYLEDEDNALYCVRRYPVGGGYTLIVGGILDEQESGAVEYAILKKSGSSGESFQLHLDPDIWAFLRKTGYETP